MSEKNCTSCGASIDFNSTECKYCGQTFVVQPPQYQQQPQYQQPQQAPLNYNTAGGVPFNEKSKIAAGLLGIFLGGLGIHKFYLGKAGMGVLYLLFCWTFIPSLVGFIEGIIYLTSSDEAFYYKYVK